MLRKDVSKAMSLSTPVSSRDAAAAFTRPLGSIIKCKPTSKRQLPIYTSRTVLRTVARMHVPADSFSGQSPERKAAVALRSLFTFVAARVVLEQLQGPGGPGHSSYNQQAYLDLMDFLDLPMKGDGGDEWLAKVMGKNHALAMRLMEVREAYLEEFEWQQMAELASRETREANIRLMRAAALASLNASLASEPVSNSGAPGSSDLDGPSPPPPMPPPQSA